MGVRGGSWLLGPVPHAGDSTGTTMPLPCEMYRGKTIIENNFSSTLRRREGEGEGRQGKGGEGGGGRRGREGGKGRRKREEQEEEERKGGR